MDRNCLSAEAYDEKGKAPTTHLITLLDQVAYRFPDHDAIISHHQTDTLNATRPLHWSFAQLQQMSIQLAARLSSKGAQWALLFCASARLGCQFVPLDPRVLDRDDHDILSLLNQLEPAAMFVSTEAISNRIDQIKFCQKHRSLVQCVVADEETTMSAGWTTLTKIMSEPLNGTPILPGPGKLDDIALILFTSGTTALPKGCPHTSISIGAQALGLMDHLDVGPGANLCQHLPNFHVFNVTLTLAFWLAGATVSFPSPSFNTQSSVQLIRSYPGVSVPCVPAMVHALSNCVSPEHSSRLSFQMFLGGAPVTLDVVKRSRDLGATRVMVGYGMTEGIAILNTSIDTTSLDLINRDISVGKIFSGGRVRICALGSRTPIHKEEIGEVHLSGLPIATGDQGYMDGDGYLYLLGRYKDLIIRGGENISPLKIERCLGEVSEITEACVIGIPDATAGEVPVTVIRKDPSTQAPKQKTIQIMILNKLGASFAPARVLDLLEDLRKDTYPTTTSGKIQKAMLREWVIDHLNQVAVENPVSFNDLTSELTKFWSAITGLAVGDIDPDVSIRTFADSIMQIQFCHLIGQKLQLVIRQSDLIKFNTIQQQAKLLKERMQLHAKDSRCYDSAHGHPIQLDMERAKLVASSKLDPLGFRWDDIQEVIPISDYLYLAMHPSADWMRLQVIDGGTVEDVKCVATYKLNDPEYDYIDTNGPLFRATTLSVNNPSVVGLVMHLHHLMFDAHILSRWFEDLRDLLNHKEELLNFHPYRDYITDYHSHRTGAISQKAVDFHVDRIRGVSSATDALWPPQIAPHWLKGDNQGWVHSDNTPGCSSERPLLDRDKSCGTKGISRAVLVPKILELQYKFAITPPIIAKCAHVLLNVRMTGAKEAIFGVIKSGRTWPSADESQPDNKEMEILEVDGPTITHILNRTRITPEETVIQLLARITKDQDDVVSHIYAPINEICRKLDDSDKKSFIDIVHRQSFNWIMGGYKEHASDPIKRIEAIARPNLGLSWLPALLEGNMLRLTVLYDDAQLRASEVHNIITEFLCAVAWLSDPANMDKNVA
ncbi:hypothetical protein N7476_009233 [Penicillium atrosanguineum]|uniref:Carrier domain-containing protein n=1 Tax=Penicillium atrosanguineum TaxID=1132637 RepID=A0A9W9PPV1_9EURO|nr:hypothetical protein N7476_009233 [Penicillium atrosanguineum]